MAKLNQCEFASKLGVHRQQLRRWVKAGHVFPPPVLGRRGGRVVVLFEEYAVVVPKRKPIMRWRVLDATVRGPKEV